MEEQLIAFYKTLDPKKFKYFVKDSSFYIYGSDIDYLPLDIRPKGEKSFIRLQSVETIVKDLLIVKKVPVEEYSNYRLTKRGFPGNYEDFLDLCLSDTIPPTIFSVVQEENGRLDVSFIRDSKIQQCNFYDDDLLSNLFSLCSSNNCIEILFNNSHHERIFNTWGIASIRSKYKSSEEMIKKYMKTDFETVEFDRQDCCLLNIADFDLVDFGLVTTQGKRLLNQWLRSPCLKLADINRRLDITEAFSHVPISINGFSDLKRIVAKISNGSITPQETVKLCQTLEQIDNLLYGLKTSAKQHSELINDSFIIPLENMKALLYPLTTKIRETIDFNTGRIHTHLSEELTRLETEKFSILSLVESEFLRVKKDYPKVSFSNKCFRVSRLEYNQSSFDTKKYVVVSMLKSGVSFITKTLSDMNEKISAIEAEISRVEGKIFESVVSSMHNFLGVFETFNYLIALIDIHTAFGTKVSSGMYSRPVFSNEKYHVVNMHHPALEYKGCILNSIEFTKSVCVVTGPNMGGKSTFLKALSMVSLYAQIGSYVPAKSAILPIFDRIFLRMGARDCASQKQSTFMIEMCDLNKILRTTTRQSLILIDELGRGTSAVDGLSLALSVRNFLIKLGAKTVMATHFSELGNDETMNKKVHVEGKILTYRLIDGICDLSFGINVAEMAGFPVEVLESARAYIS